MAHFVLIKCIYVLKRVFNPKIKWNDSLINHPKLYISNKAMNRISDSYHISTIFIFIQKKVCPIHF